MAFEPVEDNCLTNCPNNVQLIVFTFATEQFVFLALRVTTEISCCRECQMKWLGKILKTDKN